MPGKYVDRFASLNEYMRLFHPAYAIRVSEKNFGTENHIKAIPLYAVFCIGESPVSAAEES